MILQVWIQPSFCLSQEYVSFIFLEFSPIPYLFRAVRNNCLRQKNRDELKNKILTILYNHTNTPYDNPNFYIEEELIRKIEKSIHICRNAVKVTDEDIFVKPLR